MTRKEAIIEAIGIISAQEEDEQKKKEVIAGLRLCLSELPFAHWSKQAIFDTCDQWIKDHGRSIKVRDFDLDGLPPHPVIKNRFGITAKEFRDKYYPMEPAERRVASMYHDLSTEELNEIFVAEFHRVKARGLHHYDKSRGRGTPCASTLLRANDTTWKGLLKKLGLRCYDKWYVDRTYSVTFSEPKE